MSVSEVRSALAEVLERVWAGEEVTLTRHGEPVAVLVRPDRLRARRVGEAWAGADQIRDLLAGAAGRSLDARPALGHERAEELVAEVRASRSDR